MLGLGIFTFGVSFLTFGVLEFLRLTVSNSYVCGLGILTFGVLEFLRFWVSNCFV